MALVTVNDDDTEIPVQAAVVGRQELDVVLRLLRVEELDAGLVSTRDWPPATSKTRRSTRCRQPPKMAKARVSFSTVFGRTSR